MKSAMNVLRDRFPDAKVHTLTELQYAEPSKGPWKIYIYAKNGYHTGGKWFRAEKPKYPDEEITFDAAWFQAQEAIKKGREVRVCDGGDFLVFHSVDGKTVYGETFWNEAKPDPAAQKAGAK